MRVHYSLCGTAIGELAANLQIAGCVPLLESLAAASGGVAHLSGSEFGGMGMDMGPEWRGMASLSVEPPKPPQSEAEGMSEAFGAVRSLQSAGLSKYLHEEAEKVSLSLSALSSRPLSSRS
jgi:hypothetical protein